MSDAERLSESLEDYRSGVKKGKEIEREKVRGLIETRIEWTKKALQKEPDKNFNERSLAVMWALEELKGQIGEAGE